MKRLEREWMYKRLDERKRVRREFVTGVCEFLEFTKTQRDFQSNGQIRCPCRDCQNLRFKDIRSVKEDLYTKGFCDHYFEWVSHGEQMSNVEPSVVGNATTNYENMVRDAFPHSFGHEYVDDVELVQEDPNPKSKEFFDMLNNAQEPLYDGCNMTIMEMASRLMDLKCDHNLAHRCVDGIAAFLDDFIPAENSMTRTFYETKKILKGLELPVEKIHACPNGCMLFWKNDINLEKCKVCDRDRYKITSGSHREARKILTYFPLTPRLQRLYATSQVVEQMRWHKDNPRVSGTMAHPSDGEAWKHFDSVYPEFASESRNVRLGLCTDGFAPHGKFGGSYSCWPVILTPYNLPPWLCMKKQFMFLSMIIPGPKAPKANLDVYLQPLIDELNKLWDTGEITYDVSMKKNFTLKAALMWTINDFPAYGMLSGWSTSGLHGCPCCMEKSRAFSLQYGKKVSWFDCHRQFLPEDHPYRRNKNAFYINRVESRPKPKRKNGEQLWDEVSSLPKATDPNFITIMKSLKKNGLNGWTKQSIFWELPYWKDLLIRHNLDVMHVEKNFFEQLIHTIMNVKDYTSDNVNARKDLKLYCNRPGLALNKDAKIGDAKAKAPYELDKAQKKVLLQWVEKLKFPDGYASDFARCVDLNKLKLFNLKSHDCHVFLERLLPVAFKHLLPDNVWKAVTEISQFFRDLCASTITIEDMRRLDDNIPEIICKLEKIFPPSFFNSMEHLPIHLPYEAKVGGPVQYRWMYPFERFLNHLKSKISNKARVEGSICNAYLTEEISNFVKRYLHEDVDTKTRDMPRNAEKETGLDMDPNIPEICRHNREFSSVKGKRRFLNGQEYARAHLYVLSNCQLGDYESEFVQYILQNHPNTNVNEVWSKFEDAFPRWFKDKVISSNVEDDIVRALAMGPITEVKTWKRCSMNGFKFHTFEYGKHKSTMNYGVCVRNLDGVDFFGILEEILELTYCGSQTSFSALLFKCRWMDSLNGVKVHENYKLVEVNHLRKYPKYDPFVLAIQASQVYYSSYPSLKNNMNQWWAVFKTKPRYAIDAPVDSNILQEQEIEEHGTLAYDFEELDQVDAGVSGEEREGDEMPLEEREGAEMLLDEIENEDDDEDEDEFEGSDEVEDEDEEEDEDKDDDDEEED